MSTQKLRVISKPAEGTRTVFWGEPNTKATTIFTGSGSHNLLCGNCGANLAKGIERGQYGQGIVFGCKKCGSYNEVQ